MKHFFDLGSNLGVRHAAFAAFFILLCCACPARAACNLSATQTGTMDWGTLAKPSSGSQTFDITAADATSGTGSFIYGTTPVHGTFNIADTGSCGGGITITVADAGGAAGVTLSNFHLNYNGATITNGSAANTDPPHAGFILKIGATATYTSAVPIGLEHPTFHVTVSNP
jgi:hypothetical protein